MAWGSRIDHYENFPVASVLCPPRWRAAVVALYRFARTADDVADEGDAPPEARLAALAALRDGLRALWHGDGHPPPGPPTLPGAWTGMWAALDDARRRHALPLVPLLALLEAFEQDVRWTAEGRRYRDAAELLAYCERSANPVGRLLLHLAGVDDTTAQRESDAWCTALQLVNLWQDVGVDLARGRCYLPDAWLHDAGLRPEAAPSTWDDARLARVVERGCRLAAQHLRCGWGLPRRVGGRFGWELRLVGAGAATVLERIAAWGYRTRQRRPRLHPWDTAGLLWRAWRWQPPAVSGG